MLAGNDHVYICHLPSSVLAAIVLAPSATSNVTPSTPPYVPNPQTILAPPVNAVPPYDKNEPFVVVDVLAQTIKVLAVVPVTPGLDVPAYLERLPNVK